MTALDLAQRYVGVGELAGEDHPLIQWWHSLCSLGNNQPDETPWCSSFVNGVAWELRLPRSKSAAARSWLAVGTVIPLSAAAPGWDVVVLSRGSDPASGHVGFYAGQDGTNVHVCGGNQGNAVSVASFPVDRVLGVRRLSAQAPAVAGLAAVPLAPSAASVAPSGPSMQDAINLTRGMTLPPIGQTQGPDGSMTQLEGDIRHWLQYRETGMDWWTYQTKFGTVAGRIRRLYPQYLLWAVRQMVLTRGMEIGVTTLGRSWDRFGGAAGPVVGAALREYLVDWEVTP